MDNQEDVSEEYQPLTLDTQNAWGGHETCKRQSRGRRAQCHTEEVYIALHKGEALPNGKELVWPTFEGPEFGDWIPFTEADARATGGKGVPAAPTAGAMRKWSEREGYATEGSWQYNPTLSASLIGNTLSPVQEGVAIFPLSNGLSSSHRHYISRACCKVCEAVET